jgi:hypothetical protein
MSVAKYSDNFDVHAFELSLFHSYATFYSLRSLAAFFPDDDIIELCKHVKEFLDEKGIGFERVMTIVRGRRVHPNTQLADLRLIMTGVNPVNNRKMPKVLEYEVIQMCGKYMMSGVGLSKMERMMSVNRKTIYVMDQMLGIRKSKKEELVAAAMEAAESGTSIKGFIKQINAPRTTARRWLDDAKRVRNSDSAAQ